MKTKIIFLLKVAGLAAIFLSSLAAGFGQVAPAQEANNSWEVATNGLGSWIWTDKCFDGQTCRFWRAFEIPDSTKVVHAWLRISADNEFALAMDGRDLARSAEWRDICQYDVTALLKPGRHVLAVSCFNSAREAGMICGFEALLADGKVIAFDSDTNWLVVPNDVPNWQSKSVAQKSWVTATVVGKLGNAPWEKFVNIVTVTLLPPPSIPLWQTSWFQILLVSLVAAGLLVSVWLMIQLTLHRKENLLIQEERARIARDIHDDIGARISQMVLHGEVAKREQPAARQRDEQLDRMCEEGREVLSAIDEVLWAVSPQWDTIPSFVTYICSYAQEFFQATAIQCTLDVESGAAEKPFDLSQRRGLMLAVKEALRNVAQHSGAKEVVLKIQECGQNIIVTIKDNGKGFDPQTANPERNGLTNMRERIHGLAGTCIIESQPGAGCRIEFSIPLKHPMKRRSLLHWFSAELPNPAHRAGGKIQPGK